jgi:hypothetical protein
MKALDNRGEYSVILESDKHKDNPPTFLFRYLTLKNEAEFEQLNIALAGCQSKAESIDRIVDVLEFSFVGISNISIDPDDEIWDHVTYDEAQEIFEAILKANNPGLELKKKSDLPSDSPTEPSAKDARFHVYAPDPINDEPELNALNVMEPGASNAMGQVV